MRVAEISIAPARHSTWHVVELPLKWYGHSRSSHSAATLTADTLAGPAGVVHWVCERVGGWSEDHTDSEVASC